MSPPHAFFFKAGHWPWDNIFSVQASPWPWRKVSSISLSGRMCQVFLMSERRCQVFLMSERRWPVFLMSERRWPVSVLSGRRCPVSFLSDRSCPVFLLSSLSCMEVLNFEGHATARFTPKINSLNFVGFSLYWCYYPHTRRESVSSVSRMFKVGNRYNYK